MKSSISNARALRGIERSQCRARTRVTRRVAGVALLLATGCRTSGGALDVAGVAALTAGAGVALSETSVGGCGDCYFPPGGMLILGGELVASLAIIDALLLYSREQGSRDQERALAVDRAGELIHKAIQAARAHHCDPVFALDPEIRALDRTTHDVVFM